MCREKQVFYVTETAAVTGTSFLKILDNSKLDTHTLGRTPLTSYQVVAQTTTYTTHYKHNRRLSMPSAGFEPAIAVIK
jgi:hypothetical protein